RRSARGRGRRLGPRPAHAGREGRARGRGAGRASLLARGGGAAMTRPDVGRLIGMTVGFARSDAEAAAALLSELGFEAVEVHLLQLAPGIPGVPVFEGHAAALGESLRRSGLVVSTLNGAGAPGF